MPDPVNFSPIINPKIMNRKNIIQAFQVLMGRGGQREESNGNEAAAGQDKVVRRVIPSIFLLFWNGG